MEAIVFYVESYLPNGFTLRKRQTGFKTCLSDRWGQVSCAGIFMPKKFNYDVIHGFQGGK